MDRLIGGWSFDGIARIQSGRMLDFGNVRLVGMTKEELQDTFKLRFDHAGRAVYMLPEDIVENTVRAFSVSATSASGYSGEAPTGRSSRRRTVPTASRSRRLRRLRDQQPRRYWTAAGAIRSERGEAHADQRPGQLRVPRRVPQRVQPPVVHPGHRPRNDPDDYRVEDVRPDGRCS